MLPQKDYQEWLLEQGIVPTGYDFIYESTVQYQHIVPTPFEELLQDAFVATWHHLAQLEEV